VAVSEAKRPFRNLTLSNGHFKLYFRRSQKKAIGFGRTITPERTPVYSRYKFVTDALLKPPRNGRFASETATWIQK
jgi:hypothetical protein